MSIEVLIVCGLNSVTEFLTTYEETITRLTNSKKNINYTTINWIFGEPDTADLYISEESDEFIVITNDMKNNEDIMEQIYNGNGPVIHSVVELNRSLKNKYDFVIYEHCPITSNIEYVKYYEMIKPGGYLIHFTKKNFGSGESNDYQINAKCKSFETIFEKIEPFIFKKTTNLEFNITDVIEKYQKFCYKFNPLK